jgi:hypothetical protein
MLSPSVVCTLLHLIFTLDRHNTMYLASIHPSIPISCLSDSKSIMSLATNVDVGIKHCNAC